MKNQKKWNFEEKKCLKIFLSFLGRSPKWYQKSKNLGFLEFSDSYVKKKFRPKFALFLKILFFWFFGRSWKLFQKIFSPKEILDQDLFFGFCFIKIGRLESTFWGGVPLLGGGLWPDDDAHALILIVIEFLNSQKVEYLTSKWLCTKL